MATAAPADLSWRERRRSRLAEVVDGGAMMFSDVAVVRAAVVCGVLLLLSVLARHRSNYTWALAVAACAFLFSEMLNTLVEMVVDRISLEPHVFSARIKHAAAFLSACVGVTAFGLAAVVLYQVFFRVPPETSEPSAPASGPASAPASSPASKTSKASGPRAAERHDARDAGMDAPDARQDDVPDAGQDDGPDAGQDDDGPAATRITPRSPAPAATHIALRPEGSGNPADAVALRARHSSIQLRSLRWLRRPGGAHSDDASAKSPFSSSHVSHPMHWQRRTQLKRRYRRRRS